MSWLSELAGKAENILNKLDSEAASVLTNDQAKSESLSQGKLYDSVHKRSSSTCSLPSSSSVPHTINDFGNVPHLSLSQSYLGYSSRLSSPKKSTVTSKATTQESSCTDLLNTDVKNNCPKTSNESIIANIPQVDTDHSRHSSISSGSSFLAVSGRVTPRYTAFELETNSGSSNNSEPYLNIDGPSDLGLSSSFSLLSNESEGSVGKCVEHPTEAVMLKKEVLSLNQEMVQILKRTKQAEKDLQVQKDKFSTLSLQQKQSEALLRDMQNKEVDLQESIKGKDTSVKSLGYKINDLEQNLEQMGKSCKGLKDQNQRLLQGADKSSTLHTEIVRTIQEKLNDTEELLQKERTRFMSLEKENGDSAMQLEDDLRALSKELSEAQERSRSDKDKIYLLSNQISSLKTEVSSSSDELSDYKAKAGRILQAKDAIIASLREGQGGASHDGFQDEEIEQLQQERNLMRDELAKCHDKLRHLSDEATHAEERLHQEERESLSRQTQLQQDLLKERSDTSLLQEELRQVKQELKNLQEDLARHKINSSTRVQERDVEIQRLQKQIAHKQSSSSGVSELENRIHAVTESLILKQSTIESLSTDKHTLQIQMEKLQQQYNESETLLNRHTTVEFSNEDVRNRPVPTFLMESPFDGGVTRGVKKAYGSLDKFSCRLGFFLRRYPIARVFVLIYMGLLHLWVMVVLITYQPEAHADQFLKSVPLGSIPKAPADK